MAAAPKRLLFLTGAPVAADLSWNNQNCNAGPGPRLRRYLGIADADDDAFLFTQTQTAASFSFAKWRQVPFRDSESQEAEAPRFLSFHESDLARPSQEHMNFLQHSLAVLQNLDSSQICAAPDETAYNETTFVSALSSNSDTSYQTSYGSSFSTNATGEPSQQIVNFNGQITDLQRIPTARHLDSIHPQTMTINILASVISLQPARTVRLRKRSGEMDIIEILLGDETRAGFPISFWLPPAADNDSLHHQQRATRSGPGSGPGPGPSGIPKSNDSNNMRDILAEVRSGDTLLITHIALGQFNGNVYGQSLSRRITRNNTSVVKLTEGVIGLSAQAMVRMKKVKEWSANFVGRPGVKRAASPSSLETAANGKKRRSILPPDTQPGLL
ncbi:Putative nucleic acid-binding protein [Septoria linicola]|uniref:Nucleic acid-binding protein n=1 Tax=Septoria linicola TaxID=215465 RepID=A0A9Q9APB9_9PEZI|nr:Putative nucleic acid-binding protein [Septoria linicola]